MKIKNEKEMLFKDLQIGEVCQIEGSSYCMKTEEYHDANVVYLYSGMLVRLEDEEEVILVDCELLIN